ncbi:MAG: hypothetical protein K2W88_06990, partial [Pararheinheimera sp.]|nr:hypothetical protein [Rheinheimera sp.]
VSATDGRCCKPYQPGRPELNSFVFEVVALLTALLAPVILRIFVWIEMRTLASIQWHIVHYAPGVSLACRLATTSTTLEFVVFEAVALLTALLASIQWHIAGLSSWGLVGLSPSHIINYFGVDILGGVGVIDPEMKKPIQKWYGLKQ